MVYLLQLFSFRFSIGQLPKWAKKQFTEDTVQPPSLTKGVAAPKGRWAQRAETAMGVKSFYSNNSYQFPHIGEKSFIGNILLKLCVLLAKQRHRTFTHRQI